MLLFWLFLGLLRHAQTSPHIHECPTVVDILFMIDSSKTMGIQEFADNKAFISGVIPYLRPSSKGTHVGILAFSNSAHIEHSFTNKQDNTAIQKALSHIYRSSGTANSIIAFNEASRQLNQPHGHGNQHKPPRVLVFVSNGKDPLAFLAESAAQAERDDGVVIIALGMEYSVDEAQLEKVASSKHHVVTPKSTSDASAIRDIVSMICAAGRKPEAIVSRSAEESALRGHVIATVHAWDDFACAFKCLHTRNCFSFNFKEGAQVCELNHSNRLATSKDLIMDLDSNYYELVF